MATKKKFEKEITKNNDDYTKCLSVITHLINQLKELEKIVTTNFERKHIDIYRKYKK